MALFSGGVSVCPDPPEGKQCGAIQYHKAPLELWDLSGRSPSQLASGAGGLDGE
jgi:hypothetical protein